MRPGWLQEPGICGRAVAPVQGNKRSPHGFNRVLVGFDDEMFATLKARAAAEGTPFAEQVRKFVQWGIDSEGDVGAEWDA